MKLWKKGKIKHITDYKLPGAWYLVINFFVKLKREEWKHLDLRNGTQKELQRLTEHECVTILEKRGWKFLNIKNNGILR